MSGTLKDYGGGSGGGDIHDLGGAPEAPPLFSMIATGADTISIPSSPRAAAAVSDDDESGDNRRRRSLQHKKQQLQRPQRPQFKRQRSAPEPQQQQQQQQHWNLPPESDSNENKGNHITTSRSFVNEHEHESENDHQSWSDSSSWAGADLVKQPEQHHRGRHHHDNHHDPDSDADADADADDYYPSLTINPSVDTLFSFYEDHPNHPSNNNNDNKKNINNNHTEDENNQITNHGNEIDNEMVGAESSRTATTSTRGAILPLYCGPCMTRTSSCIVQKAPCFWLTNRRTALAAISTTDRAVLYRLNVLCAILAMGQIGAGAFLVTVLYSDSLVDRYNGIVQRRPEGVWVPIDLWNLNGSVILNALLGCILFGAVLYTLRVVRNVNLRGAVRYLWTLVWLLPLQIFLVISLFDYHRVMEVWVRHWWYLPIMAWFRYTFCGEHSYNTMCMVPVQGNPEFSTEEEWCAFHFPDLQPVTTCRDIRDSAQATMNGYMYFFYTTCGVWGLVLVCLMFFAISLLENIITRPIVQTSRESNVPGWMLLPIVGCFTAGSVLLFSPSSVISGSSELSTSNWVGVLYVIAGGCFFISASLGWFIGSFSILNSNDKRNKNLAVVIFIVLNVILLVLLAAIFSGGIVIATSIVDVPLSQKQVGRAACDIDAAESCSNCGNRFGEQECPEWTKGEVHKVLNTQYKSSATFAAIFMIYAFSALRFGIGLRRHITMYQIDYV